MVKLTPEERERIRSAIECAEQTTSGEIGVRVVGRSVRLPWIPSIVLGLVTAAASWLFLRWATWGWPGPWEWTASACAGLVGLAAGLLWIPRGRGAKDSAVWDRAQREFDRLGIGTTADATGVLVLISLHEREAVVLADKAINEKVPPDTWSREVKVITDGIKAGRTCDGIVSAVSEVGALLSKHYPRRDDDKNELPDDVVIR